MADKAFLNGINNYKSISDLRGCENDVEELASLLVDEFGFDSNNIRKRTSKDVTKEQIRKGWKWLLRGAKAGDRLVFHFSGHGSYTVDQDDDENEDRRDELLCLYDMDWSDPESYLLDDELWTLTQDVPDGVLLTVLLDCCHSGTGTRAMVLPTMMRSLDFKPEKVPLVIIRDSAERAGDGEVGYRVLPSAAEEEEEAERRDVLARFVHPPPSIRERARKAALRSSFRSSRSRADERGREINHVLFAGCRDDQTSADAYLSGDYRGAFTHGFCRQVKKHGESVEHQSLIEAVRAWMRRNSFSQVPQLEPAEVAGPLFRFGQPEQPGSPSADSSTGKDDLLIELLQEMLGYLREGRTPAIGTVAGERVAGRDLVYVHGICEHAENYSQPWWEAMKPHLPARLAEHFEEHRHEVNWSNIVNDRAIMEAATRADDLRAVQVAAEIKAVLQDRSERILLEGTPRADRQTAPRSLERSAVPRGAVSIPGLNCADDFARYLTQSQTRRRILDRFLGVVRPKLESGSRLEIISHSWGTVVAYEGLRELDDELFSGRVSNLFTVGSALSIWPVKRMLADPYRDGRKPRHVKRWINLDAQSDAVGGPLMNNPFEVDREFLGLYPAGCEEQGFLGITWFNPSCAHSSYFDRENRAVNRDIFARFLND